MTYGMFQLFMSDMSTDFGRGSFAGFLSGTVQALNYANKDFADCQPTVTQVFKSLKKMDSEAAASLENALAVEVIESVIYSLCSEAISAEPTESGAWEACQSFVAGRLKLPPTAQFPDEWENSVLETLDDYFVVDSYVDSKSPAGEVIKTDFKCDVFFDRESGFWELANLELGRW